MSKGNIDELVERYAVMIEENSGVSLLAADVAYEDLEESARRIDEITGSIPNIDSLDIYDLGTKASTWDTFADIFNINATSSTAKKAALSAATIVTLYFTAAAIGQVLIKGVTMVTNVFKKETRKCSTLLGKDEEICLIDARIKMLEEEMKLLKSKVMKACPKSTDEKKCKKDVSKRVNEIKKAIEHFDRLKLNWEDTLA